MANRGNQYYFPTAERPFEDKLDSKSFDTENNLLMATASLRKMLQTTAETSEEKFKVLDARDKLYKIMKDKDPSLNRGALVATCPDMCPEKERLLREYQGRGSIFEMTNYSKNSSFNHSLAVKEYARSSADQEEPLPHDLRPINVLTMTMSHLLHNVVDFCELSDDNLEEWYMFMWDRTRALRKELTQQGVCNAESVTLVEQCARFHIHCAERLVDQDSSIYDDKINTENLTKCLQTLKYMYKDLAKEDIKCPNECEFICYSLLLNLNNSSVFTELSDMPECLMASGPVKFALDVMTTWETRNYIRFFNLVKKTTYLNCCLLRRYFEEMRLYAIKTMIRSYCTKNYSPQIVISRFVETLNFEGEEDCINFLAHCNFNFHKVDNQTVVNFDRVQFQNPENSLPSGRAFIFIEEKKQQPLSVIMAGGVLPPKLFEGYVPQDSFTANGELKPDSLQIDINDISYIPPAPTRSESLTFKASSNKPTAPTLNPFQKVEDVDIIPNPLLDKKTEEKDSSDNLFASIPQDAPSSNIFAPRRPLFGGADGNSNIFGSNFQNSDTPKTRNIFESSEDNQPSKSWFSTQSASVFSNTSNNNIFGARPTTFSAPSFITKTDELAKSKKPEENTFSFVSTIPKPSYSFGSTFQPKSDITSENLKWKEQEQKEKEELESEKLKRQIEEEREREKEKARLLKMISENKRLEEERQRKELERKQKEEREAEKRKQELARIKKEEENRRKEESLKRAHAEYLAELSRQEEKRKADMAYKRKVDNKLSELKRKMQQWKTKMVFEKWRMKTWSNIEGRKMKEYFKEVKVKYPPVCTEQILNGNPYGLVIPSVLAFEKFQEAQEELNRETKKKLVIVNDDLPLIKLNSILGRSLEDRSKSLNSKLDPFPWKLVISIPDELESPQYWKSLETFVEMHFVESFNWQFGIQKGPLYCRAGCRGSFRYYISVRRLLGCGLFEGNEPNSTATTGSNALIFFMSENVNEITSERLKTILKSRPPLPKIPVTIFALNCQFTDTDIEKVLKLESWKKSHVSVWNTISATDGKHELINKLIEGLNLSVSHSAPPPSLRTCELSTFFTTTWFDTLWRRIEICLSDFKVTVQDPKPLIEFYNSCIEELIEVFLDKSYDQETVLAEEFSGCEGGRPNRTLMYKEKLSSLLSSIKLPQWPAEIPKSSHQLNYRIHQYCKKVIGQDRVKIKNLKWMLYRVIRRSLLWKGLDIYCDEDINEILINFPWAQVFQEISKALTQQLHERAKGFKVIYDIERIDKFSFESSLAGRFFRKSKSKGNNFIKILTELSLRSYNLVGGIGLIGKNPNLDEDLWLVTGLSSKKLSQTCGEEELDKLNPCLEKDSIVYAYSAAVEREKNKRKREECIDESLDALFSSPAGKRIVIDDEETKVVDYSEIKSNFESIGDRLDEIKKRINENANILMDFHNSLQ